MDDVRLDDVMLDARGSTPRRCTPGELDNGMMALSVRRDVTIPATSTAAAIKPRIASSRAPAEDEVVLS